MLVARTQQSLAVTLLMLLSGSSVALGVDRSTTASDFAETAAFTPSSDCVSNIPPDLTARRADELLAKGAKAVLDASRGRSSDDRGEGQ